MVTCVCFRCNLFLVSCNFIEFERWLTELVCGVFGRMSLWRNIVRNSRLQELLSVPRVVVGEVDIVLNDREDDEERVLMVVVDAEEAVEAEIPDVPEDDYVVTAAVSALAAAVLAGAAVYCAVRR